MLSFEKVGFSALGGDKIQFSFSVKGKFDVFSAEQKRVCMTASQSENEKNADNAALIIYYSKKGERLWDIAKRYGSTLKAISEENEISGEALTEDKMLMIPLV